MRILVVEDERKVASFLRQGLEEEGHAVEVAGDGAVALDLMQGDQAYDLVVLDVMLPKRDGFEVLKALRAQKIRTPVLMLTARDGVADRVAGLDAGADDYLTKPFAFEEFLARVRAPLADQLAHRSRCRSPARRSRRSLPATHALAAGSKRRSIWDAPRVDLSALRGQAEDRSLRLAYA
jgi:DNA-binding response OmpR family regulator